MTQGMRKGLTSYGDPGWYAHPAGTVAGEWSGNLDQPARAEAKGVGAMAPLARPAGEIEVTVRKPGGRHSGH